MNEADVIIIGAGVCGLAIARALSKKGYQVIVLEARNRLGGRIHTVNYPGISTPMEAGAEFIHGRLPITLGLLDEAGIEYDTVEGAMVRIRDAKDHPVDFDGQFPFFENKLENLKEDTSVYNFLKQHFEGKGYESLRNSISGFVEGYDAADIHRASTFALRDEWLEMGEEDQYRIRGGYGRLVEFLAGQLTGSGGEIHLTCIVKKIRWSVGSVEITSGNDEIFKSRKVVITVPLGVLTADPKAEATIIMEPTPESHLEAARMLGFGKVVKLLLLFDHAFWKETGTGIRNDSNLSQAGFILSNAAIPTWWTRYPGNDALLAGWLAGPKAGRYMEVDNTEILADAIRSLAYIFQLPERDIESMLISGNVYNWVTDPFTSGGYAYRSIHSEKAIKILQQPVSNTIFFAGEALYAGKSAGTVEAALQSALDTSEKFQPLN